MAQKCRNTLLKSRSGFDDIERMGHAGWRRIMIERYRVGEEVRGIAAYLRDSGGVRLDHDRAARREDIKWWGNQGRLRFTDLIAHAENASLGGSSLGL